MIKIEITVDVIVHATEDADRIIESFGMLGLERDDFEIGTTTGHFDNPITLLTARLAKDGAHDFMGKLVGLLGDQVRSLTDEIEERTVDSRFYMRLDKQELVKGRVTVSDSGTIKLRIHTPIYNKRDVVSTFAGIFQIK